MDQRAGKRYRLRKRGDIDRVFREGRRKTDGCLTLLAVPNGLAWSRAGVGVSKRHGGAVRRNRVKRLCREAFRTAREELPVGVDYMVIPRPGAELTFERIRDSLRRLARRVCDGTREASE